MSCYRIYVRVMRRFESRAAPCGTGTHCWALAMRIHLEAVLRIRDILVRIRISTSDKWIRLPILVVSSVIFRKATKNFFLSNLLRIRFYFLKGSLHLHNFSKIKSHKEVQNSRNQGFSYYFCLTIKWPGSGFVPLTNRSRRPKNLRLLVPQHCFEVLRRNYNSAVPVRIHKEHTQTNIQTDGQYKRPGTGWKTDRWFTHTVHTK